MMSEAASLTGFTFAWAQVAALQCVKLWYSSSRSTLDSVIGITLCVVLLMAMIVPYRSYSLLLLAFTHAVSLMYQGSQSNHVLVALAINLAVLLNYSTSRTTWSKQFSGSIVQLLVVLYLIPCLHKLNYDWFNARFSCASLFFSGVLAQFTTSTHWSLQALVTTAPIQAILIETLLPCLLVLARVARSSSTRTLCFKCFIALACSFHLLLALPLPPMSVYPFSAVMFPILLPLVNTQVSHSSHIQVLKSLPFIGILIAIVTYLVSIYIQNSLQLNEQLFEYPAYGLYQPALVWILLIVIYILSTVLSYDKCNGIDGEQIQFTTSGWILSSCVALIGILPYIGIRTYPALAMFSNLRTERNVNHIFTPTSVIMPYVFYLAEPSYTIQETNLASLQHFQVNLGNMFTKKVRAYNQALNISNEFWISPPNWSLSNTHAFIPYSVPFIELRRHIAHAYAKNTSFFIQLLDEDGRSITLNSSLSNAGVESALFTKLSTALHWVEAYVVRFRSFDDAYSPCRH